MTPASLARRGTGPLLVVLSLGYLAYSSYQSETRLSWEQVSNLSSVGLFLGVLLFLSSNLVSAASWQCLADPCGHHIRSLKVAASIWMTSNIGKYLPGNVIHYLSRYRYSTSSGVGSIEATTALILELLTVLTAALLLTLPSFVTGNTDYQSKVLHSADPVKIAGTVSVILLLVGLVVALSFRYLPNARLPIKHIRIRLAKHLANSGTKWLQALTLCMMSFMLAAAAAYLMIYLNHLSTTFPSIDFTLLLGSYTLAFLAGYVIPGAPGGIGIREAALVFLLSPALGEANALLLALSLRLCSIVADFAGALIFSTSTSLPTAVE